MTHEFAFDLNLRAAIRVKAETLADAQHILKEKLDCATTNFGAFDNGDPILGEASLDDRGYLYQVDGEEPTLPDPLPDYKKLADDLYGQLCANQQAWEGEEDSVKEEHEDLIAENDEWIDKASKLLREY